MVFYMDDVNGIGKNNQIKGSNKDCWIKCFKVKNSTLQLMMQGYNQMKLATNENIHCIWS
jgi:hypothetical protein